MLKMILRKFGMADYILSSLTLGFVIILVIINVFSRYFLGSVFSWGEELATISFIWCVFIGAAYCYRRDTHIGIDVLYNLFPEKIRKVLDVLIEVVLVTLNATITYLGVILSINSAGKTSFILRLPYWVIDISLVVGFGLMTIYGVIRLISNVKKLVA